MAADDFKNTDVNFKLETKVGGQMEDYMLAKAVIIENHRKPRDYKKETLKKMLNNVKANGGHVAPRFKGTSSKKFSTTEFTRAISFGTIKDKTLVIEDCTDIKAKPSIKLNEV